MKIVRLPIGRINPAAYNPRKDLQPADPEYQRLLRSIERWDLVEPLVWNERSGNLVGGHQRLKILRARGDADVDVSVVDLDPNDEAALNVALNKISGEWDIPKLSDLLSELDANGFDATLTGFDLKELEGLLAPNGNGNDPDAVPPVPETPKSKLGEVYELGRHRLMCGDSTDPDDFGNLLGDGQVDLCMTDPPYGADIKYRSHVDTQDALGHLIAGFFQMTRERCSVMALTPGINNISQYPPASWMLCWFYGVGPARSPWGFSVWQPFLVYGKDPKLAAGEGCHPDGLSVLMTADDMAANRALDHACPKPASIWVKFLDRLSNKKTQTVYDPFGGSGTTLIAAEQLGRTCYMMELDPGYCDVIRKRYADFVGQPEYAP